MQCSNPISGPHRFQILYTNGIHDVNIDYGRCEYVQTKQVQHLHCGWYPAIQLSTKTSASFYLLSLLYILALTTKGNTYNFY
jgi:hypothetical protein